MFRRYRRSKLYFLLGLGFLFLFCLGFVLKSFFLKNAVLVSTYNAKEYKSPVTKDLGKILHLFNINDEGIRKILKEGCPLFFGQLEQEEKLNLNFSEVLAYGLEYITDLKISDPTTYFKTQIALLAAVNPDSKLISQAYQDNILDEGEEDFYLDTPPELDDWQFEIDNSKPVELSKDTVIFLYNTHNAETYKPTDGKSKLEGKNAGVVKATRVLKETLENKYGLKTIHSEKIHDFPDWSRSYIQSLQTAQKVLKANKKIQAVFDIHRDAGFKSKSTTTVKINGKNAVSILLVVGTEHDRWKSNLAFAQKLEKKANELYPDLVRDIRIRKNRRYNQHLHPNSVLIELGSDLNTLEEAKYSASLFAHVIAEVIKEMN